MRILAAFCIVLHHSNYLYKLGISYPLFESIKSELIAWALPFFYTTTAFFAYQSLYREYSINKIAKRLLTIAKWYLLFISMYEVLRIAYFLMHPESDYTFFHLFDHGNSLSSIVSSCVQMLRFGNYTAAYFVYDFFVIYLLGSLLAFTTLKTSLNLVRAVLGILIIFMLSSPGHVLFSQVNSFFKFTHSYELPLILSGYFFSNLLMSFKLPKLHGIKPEIEGIALLIIPFFWSFLHTYPMLPPNVALLLFCSLLFILHATLHSFNLPLSKKMSQYGRDFSFGIFLFHPIVISIVDNLLPPVLRFVGIRNHLLLYLLINITVFFSTLHILVYLKSKYQIIVSSAGK